MAFLYSTLVILFASLLSGDIEAHAARRKKNKRAVQVTQHVDIVDSSVREKQTTESQPQHAQLHKNLNVRILIDEKECADGVLWSLQSPDGFMVVDPHDKTRQVKTEIQELVISCKKTEIYINHKPVGTQVLVVPQGKTIAVQNNRYGGAFWIVSDGVTMKLINCIDIEEYVACVLMTESWPGWSLEVNKVFAIASRTYVIAMVKAAKTSKQIYHVKNTNKHQTYSGDHDCQIFKDAVEQTRGLFLTYKKKPIIAMFDACCGGIIPAHMQGVNFKDAPYLARKQACHFCKGAKVYSWQVTHHVDSLAQAMQQEISSWHTIRDCKVTKKDKAGIVKEVMLKQRTPTLVTGKKIYSRVKGVKSFCFNVHKSGSMITFKGRGLGHHLGLCQWGAKSMVDQGYAYKEVLDFYYPGTQLMRIT